MSVPVSHPGRLDRFDPPAPLHAPALKAFAWFLIFIGVATVTALLVGDAQRRAWAGVLIGTMIPTWIAVGALFFLAVHTIGNAWWTVPIRRIIEGLSVGFLVTPIGVLLIVLFGGSYLYDWWHLTGDDHRALFKGQSKADWMTPGRWTVTTGIILVAWLWLRYELVRLSLRQDRVPGEAIRPAHLRWSVIALIGMAFTFSLFTWDTLLALNVTFTSTIWGFYCFVGAVQTFLGVLVLVLLWLSRGESSPLRRIVRPHVFHDLGTWMIAWGCVVAYIAFVQYAIISFANMDEETQFFAMRTQHGYGHAYVIEAVLRSAVPFVLLMSQRLRTHPVALSAAAVAVLAGNAIDLHWIVIPEFFRNRHPPLSCLPELGVACAFVGVYVLALLNFLRRNGLVARNDPRLLPSINGEHL